MIRFPRFASSIVFALSLAALFASVPLRAQYRMERLDRGVVAVRTGTTSVFVGWRLLGTDVAATAFNVYRGATKITAAPITGNTNVVDTSADLSVANIYSVRVVIDGVEQPPFGGVFALPANAPTQQYLRVPLQQPAGGTTPAGEVYTYSPNDCSAADLDGDGAYELIVKWDPSNSKDNSQSGYTGNVYLDAYELDGTRLWRIDLGRNIRAGAHYTQFMAYDLDGDGKAEVACKTADATVSGTGQIIGNAAADYRTAAGYVLTGAEYLTVFQGDTGAILATTNYNPPRNNNPASADVSAWGDNYGNRVDRFLACVAYLDGTRPSLVMCRGYYTRACLAAWDWRDGQLTQRWVFDTGHTGGPAGGYRGQGAHSLSVADVDGDGKQEIIFGACTIDDNGGGKYTTTLGHGDALHVSDMNPNRPGLEVWMIHEDPGSYGNNGLELHDASTGEILLGVSGQGADVGRGCAGDIDSRYPGYEVWGARGGLYSANGTLISSARPGQMNFMAWWDADLKREFLDGTTISKWNETASNSSNLLSPAGIGSNNSTKATPNLSADLLGDWREEVVWRENGNDALRIYTTTATGGPRLHTLMHDPQYRVAVAWQNVAYNQPPHPGFYIGTDMIDPPQPNASITVAPALSISAQPASQTALVGQQAVISVSASDSGAMAFQWYKGGAPVADATGATLVVNGIEPANAGIYHATVSGTGVMLSKPVVLGVLPPTGSRTAGTVTTRPEWQDIRHPNGAIYDQFLLNGAAGTFTAGAGKIARISFLDSMNSIVQVEMSGSGAVTVLLESATGPAAPAFYNQSGVEYMKGRPTIILAGADQTTHVTIYSVGPLTNPGVTRSDVTYAGWADVVAFGIVSSNGQLGGLRQGNVSYAAGSGLTGLYAPTVSAVGGPPIAIHNIAASTAATPYLFFDPSGQINIKIAGGDLAQPNASALRVSGLAQVTMGAGQASTGVLDPAKTLQSKLINDSGIDVTASIVTGP